jgi:uncharacterized FlaG/YvyC family protein
METGGITRHSAIAATNVPQRTDSLVAQGATRTDLAPEKAVQQVTSADAVRFQPSEAANVRAAIDAALRETIDRRITIDPKTREVVYQAVNKETGEIVRQVPDEALMRLRAYAREMREKAEAADVRRVERIA